MCEGELRKAPTTRVVGERIRVEFDKLGKPILAAPRGKGQIKMEEKDSKQQFLSFAGGNLGVGPFQAHEPDGGEQKGNLVRVLRSSFSRNDLLTC